MISIRGRAKTKPIGYCLPRVRDCAAEALPAAETAEAEQGQRSAFCKRATARAAKTGHRNQGCHRKRQRTVTEGASAAASRACKTAQLTEGGGETERAAFLVFYHVFPQKDSRRLPASAYGVQMARRYTRKFYFFCSRKMKVLQLFTLFSPFFGLRRQLCAQVGGRLS